MSNDYANRKAVDVDIQKIGHFDHITFSLSYPFSEEVLKEFRTITESFSLKYISRIRGYAIRYPNPKLCHLYDNLMKNGFGLFGGSTVESAVKKAFQLKELKEFGEALSIERLLKEDIFEELTRSVVLHNIDVEKMLKAPENKGHTKYAFDAKKVTSLDEQASQIYSHKVCLLYNIEKLTKDEIKDIEELAKDVNLIMLASVDFNKSYKKVFPFVNIALNKRYKDISEFNSLRCVVDKDSKGYKLSTPVLDSMAA